MKVYIGILLIGVVLARQKRCVRNARYTKCGTACPLTCENLDNPPRFCAAVCIQGCQCDEGFVRTRDLGCVKPEDCPKSSIDPPATVVIKDEEGEPLETLAGPYDEGSSLLLTCEVKGGDPAPIVTWWSKDVLIDDTFSTSSQGSIINELVISKLQRSDFMKELTCLASSLNTTQFINRTVKIDMNMKPLYVRITTAQRAVKLGDDLILECETSGSRPEATISWWIDKEVIQDENQTYFSRTNGNGTYCRIHLNPGIDDNGKIVVCVAENPLLPQSDLRDTWKLNIHYKVCGENERYNECGTPCPLTCDTQDRSDVMCAQLCVEGCECEDGFARRGDWKCVRPDQCPQKEKKIPLNCSDYLDTGSCDASLLRFYYDSEEKRCKEFMFGGCGGNTNNFETEEECQAACGNIS